MNESQNYSMYLEKVFCSLTIETNEFFKDSKKIKRRDD